VTKDDGQSGGRLDSKEDAGWGSIVGHEELDGAPDEQVNVVKNPSAAGEDYAYKPSAKDLGRKQDFAVPKADSLSLPPPGSKLGGSSTSSGEGLPKAIPKAFFETPSVYRNKSSNTGLWVVLLLLAAGAAAFFFFFTEKKEAPVVATGQIKVYSQPSDAVIYLDGQKTPFVTPYTLEGIRVGVTSGISVLLPDHKAFPEQHEVTLSADGEVESVAFDLKEAVALRIETKPPGAEVTLDGRSLPGSTPLSLPPVVVGKSIAIRLDYEGHVAKEAKIEITKGMDPVRTFALTQAKTVDVVSDPAGAEVFVEGTSRGRTPLYDVPVPAKGQFSLKVELGGYQPYFKKLRASGPIDVKLKELPFTALKLTPAERREGSRLEQKLSQARKALASSKRDLAKTEKLLEKVTSSPKYMFGERAKVERAFDLVTARVTELEDEVVEAEGNLDAFRSSVLTRVGSDSETTD
jgi:hypothetical protein